MREGENILFNDTLNTFYLRLYGVEHMTKDHSDRERGNLLLPHFMSYSFQLAYYSNFKHTTIQRTEYIPQALFLHETETTIWSE